MKVLAAAIAASDSGRRPRLVRECADGCAAIERENAAWAGPQARLVLSALAYLRGDLPKALALLESAEQGLAAADMALHAAAARRRRGEILGGDEGCALVESATATMTAQGIRSPAAWTRMYAPGFDA